MSGIDAHQHFWNYRPERDSWITDEMKVLRRDFLPADLQPELRAAGLEGCVLIQTEPADEGNALLLELAEKHDWIKAVVGWTDLCHPEIDTRLDAYRKYPKLKGFRPMLQSDTQRDAMLLPEFLRGVGALCRYGYTLDLLIQPDQLPFVYELVQAFSEQPFVIDHLAKPNIKAGESVAWGYWMQRIAGFENVHCKVSGMVTEADWKHWNGAHFRPYLDLVTAAFGIGRLIYGSDWPVCLIGGDYKSVSDIARSYFQTFSDSEQEAIFGGNARRFYKF